MTPAISQQVIAVALHDGYYGLGTGAGRANRAFLTALTQAISPGVRLVVLPIALDPASTEYSPIWHAEMRRLTATVDGEVLPVSNGTGGLTRFGGVTEFRHASATTAQIICDQVLPHAGQLLITAFDTPFYGLALHLPRSAIPAVVTVPRSTALLHDPENAARIDWDRLGLHATATGGGTIAAISAHMRRHLTRGYQIPSAALTDLPDGITDDEWQHPGPAAITLPPPARAGFLLAMGRADPVKGFDDLLDALTFLKARHVPIPHTLLAAVTEDPRISPYQRHLAQRITAGNLDVTLVTGFTPAMRSLLAHPALAAVIVPSRAEPFGRIPLEAFIAGAGPVVATTAGGLAELVTDGITGYTASPASPPSLAAAIHRALTADASARNRLRAAGRHLAETRYNHHHAVTGFLAARAPWAIPAGRSPAQPWAAVSLHNQHGPVPGPGHATATRPLALLRRPAHASPHPSPAPPPRPSPGTSVAAGACPRPGRDDEAGTPLSDPPSGPARTAASLGGLPPDTPGTQSRPGRLGSPPAPPALASRQNRHQQVPGSHPAN